MTTTRTKKLKPAPQAEGLCGDKRILIADDDATSCNMLEALLNKQGYKVSAIRSGREALEIIQGKDSPKLVILDWNMPEISGMDIMQKIRKAQPDLPPYMIILTVRTAKEDIVHALQNGADDYLTKPYDHDELISRIEVGFRMLRLQRKLLDNISDLKNANAHVKSLQKILPICSYCRKIRNDQQYWASVESYVQEHLNINFSHGLCPDCFKANYPELKNDSDKE